MLKRTLIYGSILLPLLLLACRLSHAAGNTITLQGAGAPVGSCAFVMRYVDQTNNNLYFCSNGAWVLANGGGGAGTPGGSTDAVQYNAGGGTFGGLNSPTTNGNCIISFNVTASAAVVPTCAVAGVPVNAQSGNYSLIYSDRAAYIKTSGGSTQTITLPQITGPTASNFPFVTQNLNSGNQTLTANAADKIDNSATGGSATVLPNWAAFVYQDSSSAPGNWWTLKVPTFAAFGSTGALCSWSTTTGAFTCGDLTGDVTTSGSKATTLANSGVSAGSCGDSTHSCSLTVDAKGRITVQSNNTISGAGSTASGGIAKSTGVGIILTGTSYAPEFGQYTSLITSEANADAAVNETVAYSDLYVDLGTATGGAQTVTVTLRDNGVDTALTCTVGNSAQTCSDGTHSVNVSSGHLVNWKVVLNSTTLTTNVAIGVQTGNAAGSYTGNTTVAVSHSGTNPSATTILSGDANGNSVAVTALPSGITATTQSASDNSTKVATTAYADRVINAPAITGNSSLNTVRVASDFTTTSATLVAITGLSWTLPANTAAKYIVHCSLTWSEATSSTAVVFGVQDVTTAPTDISALMLSQITAASVKTLSNLTTTTATAIGTSMSPSVTTLIGSAIDMSVEQPSGSASVLQIMADIASGITLTVKRGSYCSLQVATN